jgi:diguanylate cyclase (GGDEF)-like protein
MRRPSLLVTYGLMSLVPTVLLALAVSHSLESVIRERSLERAREEATFVANIALGAYLDVDDLDAPLPPLQWKALEIGYRGVVPRLDLVRIWGRRGVLVFASDRGQPSLPEAAPREVRAAFAGETSSSIAQLDGVDVLMIRVPLTLGGRDAPTGGLEVALPYSVTAAQIDKDIGKVRKVLAAGLAFLYALLIPIVGRASRQLRRQAAENEHRALHDALTGLPNRVLFEQRLRAALGDRRATKGTMGVMLIDIDNFKEVNDTLGHPAGDLLLRTVAARVRGVVRDRDTVARLGGDELAVLALGLSGPEDLEDVADRVVASVAQPLAVGRTTLMPSASVGVAWCPAGDAEFDSLIQCVDEAMYRAKQEGGGRYRVLELPPAAAA